MQFEKIKDIDLPLKKFTETLEIGEIEWEVDTPDGWVDIQASGKTIEYDVWELLLENGIKLKAADKHIVVVYSLDKLNFVEKCLYELNPGDSILLKDDVSQVVHCKSLGYKEEMYDIQIANDNKLFYTNDIASHNSIWLANLAAKAVLAGNNVAFLSMEMADRKVVKRLGANLLGVKMKEYNKFAEDQVLLKKKLGSIGNTTLQVPGKFFIKEFPTSTASVNDIESYLLKMEDVNNTKFKVVFVDYINIMKNWRNPNSENTYMKIKQIAEDLRAMAAKNKWCVVTATQITRSGFDASDLNLTNVSESVGLIHTVDAMFGIIQDVIMHSNNEYVIKLLANRDEGYMNSKKKFNINYDYMRIDEDPNSQMWTED